MHACDNTCALSTLTRSASARCAVRIKLSQTITRHISARLQHATQLSTQQTSSRMICCVHARVFFASARAAGSSSNARSQIVLDCDCQARQVICRAARRPQPVCVEWHDRLQRAEVARLAYHARAHACNFHYHHFSIQQRYHTISRLLIEPVDVVIAQKIFYSFS